ncbi:MAG: type II secretion system secretin GspD [Gammaproteobacteria bacterium]|nr:type II secretion system secretin GspD [Gammaproteobacteria bacterium]NIR90074.1 type II secretion system secretin GspD [Gammaproteobacteria bacterium]NIU03278.1 type II secretion system secretin GspD [Gammaproteobacteria bacterium]NIV50772.1 type II secretion system secretin GspD [Gammaproteobacteria bacterium]NIV75358.1 type II secretion system secretin GspD [Gammaproteobacteria bacterium]
MTRNDRELLSNRTATHKAAWRAGAAALLVSAALGPLSGCTTLTQSETYRRIESASELPPASSADAAAPEDTRSGSETRRSEDVAFYRPGTDAFTAANSKRDAIGVAESSGNVTLNFEGTEVREVVSFILGDVFEENYVIDSDVQGSATLKTTRPVSRDTLLPLLEMVLRMNEAALVRDDGLYHVVPREEAFQGLVAPQLGDTQTPLPRSFGVRVVPLRHIAAAEMEKILAPYVHPGNIVRVDQRRNLLILAGTSQELGRLLETVRLFDVDWLAGMSVALFTPEFVQAKTLAEELEQVFGEDADGPLAGLIRLVVIERLNAVLVVTPRKAYLKKVSRWVARLDRDTAGSGQRLFVYHLQNGKAADLAEVLTQVFEDQAPVERAPAGGALEALAPENAEESGETRTAPAPSPGRVSSTAREGITVDERSPVRIIADEVNNALLIKATPQQYAKVQAALRKLDIVPLQVLIDATIAEITLTDELRFGLEWFVNHGLDGKEGTLTLDLNAPAGLAAQVPGFSYAIADSAGTVEFVLNTLASDSRLNVLSSPSLMVLNNQTAEIQVGDEVPVTTQQQQATTGVSTVVNTIEFRDTGVLLTVTPRVNAGGLVTMEVSQEVSDVAPGTGESLTPTIQQRRITSTVAVQSGETVVLGGLIRENDQFSRSGLPLLSRLPLIGALFGQTTRDRRRTELVVLITPRAVRDADEARQITEEFRGKMESLRPLTERDAPNPPEQAPSPEETTSGQAAPVNEPRPEPRADRRQLSFDGQRAAPEVPPSDRPLFNRPGR